jgi:hypothetical protein
MFGWLKQVFRRKRPSVKPLRYLQARKMARSSNGELVVVPLNPLIWMLGGREKQKGCALTEAEVCAIRDEAMCMVMPREKAALSLGVLASSAPVLRIDPERVWQDWKKIRPQIDRYMPRQDPRSTAPPARDQ